MNKFLPALVIAHLLTGCALSGTPQDTHPVSGDYCAQLEYIFANSSDGFKAIRSQPDYKNRMTLWKTSYQPLPVSCEIWQWSDRYSYVCSKVLPDKQSAMSIYDEANAIITQCSKGSSFVQRQEKLPDEKGEKTEYLRNKQVRGSTRMVHTKGLFSDDWTVYVLISSPGSS